MEHKGTRVEMQGGGERGAVGRDRVRERGAGWR